MFNKITNALGYLFAAVVVGFCVVAIGISAANARTCTTTCFGNTCTTTCY